MLARGQVELEALYGTCFTFRLVLTAKKLARKLECYKLTLECEKDKIPFYEKFGFRNNECFYMVQRF